MARNALPSEKPDYPPLLGVGFHTVTLDELRRLCVERFPESMTRRILADQLTAVIEAVRKAGLPGEFWVDGSFLTEKLDPQFDAIENASDEQREVIELIHTGAPPGCHCFLHVEYAKGHPQHPLGEWMYAYWLRQWGFSREDIPKGIAVIPIGATS
jgi:hypothetical protein